jgi:hypothetical protein
VSQVIVQYKVKPGQVERNTELVQAVYRELASSAPDGLRYATVLLDDGVTFIHIADQDTDGPSLLAGLPAFQEFQRAITERCDEPPAARKARLIGSFRLFETGR